MELNKNSISAKLYRWFYNQDAMPNNLCPYFWKLVFMWITIIPYVTITLPSQIINKFKKQSLNDSLSMTIFAYVLLFFLLMILILPISLFTTFTEGSFWDYMFPVSVFIWGGSTLILLGFGIEKLFYMIIGNKKMYDEDGHRYYGYDSKGNKIYYKEKKPNIVVEFIKAKYNKYCPKIDWKDEGNNN